MAMNAKEFMERFRNGMLPDMSEKCGRCGNPLDYHHDEPGYTIGFETKGIIRIVKVPAGEAPLEIRQKWVGVEIPTLCYESATTDASGVITGKPLKPTASYVVLQTKAIEALEKRNENAAAWWRRAGFPQDGLKGFAFNEDEVEEVEAVSPRL